jgi:hypothetical protein
MSRSEVGNSQKADEPGGNPVGGKPYLGFVRRSVRFAVPDCIPRSNTIGERVQRLLGVYGHHKRSVETIRHGPHQGCGILAFILELVRRKYLQGKDAEKQSGRDQRYGRQEKPKP